MQTKNNRQPMAAAVLCRIAAHLVQKGRNIFLFPLPLHGAVENCAVQSALAVSSAPQGRVQVRGPQPPPWSVGRGFPKGEANRNASPFGVSFVPFCTFRKGPRVGGAQPPKKASLHRSCKRNPLQKESQGFRLAVHQRQRKEKGNASALHQTG